MKIENDKILKMKEAERLEALKRDMEMQRLYIETEDQKERLREEKLAQQSRMIEEKMNRVQFYIKAVSYLFSAFLS